MQQMHYYLAVCRAFLLSAERVDCLSRSDFALYSEDRTDPIASSSLSRGTSGYPEHRSQGLSAHQDVISDLGHLPGTKLSHPGLGRSEVGLTQPRGQFFQSISSRHRLQYSR